MPILNALAGIGTEAVIGGVRYELPPLDNADWALCEDRIRNLRADPVRVARELLVDVPPEIARSLWERAYEDALQGKLVTARQMDAWCSSYDGRIYQFYLRLRKRIPEATEDEAARLLDTYGREALEKDIDRLAVEFPQIPRVVIEATIAGMKDDAIGSLVKRNAGWPEVNPIQLTPETTAISSSTGAGGTPN
jgi:hypothetical protein